MVRNTKCAAFALAVFASAAKAAAFVAASGAGAPAAAAAMRKYVPRAHGTSARVSPEARAAPILAVTAALFAPDALEGRAAR